MKWILPFFFLSQSTCWAQEPTAVEKINAYNRTNNLQMKVVSSGQEFSRAADEMTKSSSIAVVQWSGFSGAGIHENDTRAFHDMVLDHLSKFSLETKIILVAGATTDGLGSLYEKVKEQQKEGKLSNVILTGLMSEAGAAYPDSISKNLDLLWVVNSLKDSEGNPSWEVIETPGGPSQTVELFNHLSLQFGSRIQTMEHHVAEGGLIAIKEGGELFASSYRSDFAKDKNINLFLHTNVKPKHLDNAKKDKGFYAASTIALSLGAYAAQKNLPPRLRVTVQPNFHAPDPTSPFNYSRSYTLTEFLKNGHDGVKLSDYTNENKMHELLHEAQNNIQLYTEKAQNAKVWDGKGYSTNSNYYEASKYFENLVAQFKEKERFFQSFARYAEKLPSAIKDFRLAALDTFKRDRQVGGANICGTIFMGK